MPKGDKRGIIRSLKRQEKAYRAVLREVVDVPILNGFAAGLDVAAELAVAIELGTIEAQSRLLKLLNTSGIEKIENSFIGLSEAHRQTFIKKFTRMMAVDVTPLLNAGPIAAEVSKFTADNVNLIRLIGKDHLPKVAKQVQAALIDEPFSRGRLNRLFRKEWQYRDYPLRRIARDQTSKAIGAFNQTRQQQVGIESYEWLSVGDNRTRSTHMANSGEVFRWDHPPAETGHPGHEIQCFVENTFVYPAGLNGICAYPYSGKVISITTERTAKNPLIVTPNHPIKIANHGERAAKDLKIGDTCLVSNRSVFDRMFSKIYQSVESIWEHETCHGDEILPSKTREQDLYASPSQTLKMLNLQQDFLNLCSYNGHALFYDQFRQAKVTKIDVSEYSGIVYSLQSRGGLLIAEGLLVSNCRCVAVPILPEIR